MPQFVVAPALIAAVAATTTAVATGISVSQSIEAGKEARKAADFQAKELQQRALETQQEAGIKLAEQDRRQTQILASIRATAAAAGVDPSSGSAKDVLATSGEQATINDMYTKYAGNLQAQGLESEAALVTYGGKNAQRASYFTAAGQIVQGIGSIGSTAMTYGGAGGGYSQPTIV